MFLHVHVLLDVDYSLEGLEESDACLLESLIVTDLQLRVMTCQSYQAGLAVRRLWFFCRIRNSTLC
jgi:hypothetical protein